jgi:hypothetical protein
MTAVVVGLVVFGVVCNWGLGSPTVEKLVAVGVVFLLGCLLGFALNPPSEARREP